MLFTFLGLRQQSCKRALTSISDYSWIQVVFKTAVFLSFRTWLLIFIDTRFLQKSLALITSIHLLKILWKDRPAPPHIGDSRGWVAFQHPHRPPAELLWRSSPTKIPLRGRSGCSSLCVATSQPPGRLQLTWDQLVEEHQTDKSVPGDRWKLSEESQHKVWCPWLNVRSCNCQMPSSI